MIIFRDVTEIGMFYDVVTHPLAHPIISVLGLIVIAGAAWFWWQQAKRHDEIGALGRKVEALRAENAALTAEVAATAALVFSVDGMTKHMAQVLRFPPPRMLPIRPGTAYQR